VKYQGQPIQTGQISFIPEGAQSPTGGGAINAGAYDIPAATGLLAGQYRVSISVLKGPPVKETEMPGESGNTIETLPAKYNSNTELRAEVKAGSTNQFDFDLK
jgi:hypothetical protein